MSRKKLRGAAAGLAGTFCSRNNDIDRHWALGIWHGTPRALSTASRLWASTSSAPRPSISIHAYSIHVCPHSMHAGCAIVAYSAPTSFMCDRTAPARPPIL